MPVRWSRLLMCLTAAVACAAGAAAELPKSGELIYHPERILVKFAPKATKAQVEQIIAAHGLTEVRSHPAIGVKVLRLTGGRRVKETVALLNRSQAVSYAEPDYQVTALDVFPTDPRFPEQWALHNVGQTGGTTDADIDAPEAWQISRSACDVVVGVIDTGVDYRHEDLACNLWVNPGEILGNGIDDDGNGYVDDIIGWDWVSNDNNPMDDHGHGTHVSGTIAACTDNGVGIAGVTDCAQIMALKFLDASGSGWTSDAVLALLYATANGADLTSNSWGGGGYSQALRDAIAQADAEGRLFVAAAGNSGVDTDVSPHYPSSYDVPNVIAVAATDHNDRLADWGISGSNWGLVSVDLAAPGDEILSSLPGDRYDSWSGTSMATPHVSGAAALIWGMDPTLSHLCVKAQILSTVDPLSALDGKVLTGGRLNLNNALLCDGSALWVVAAPGEGFAHGGWRTREGDPSVITAYVTAGCPISDASVVARFDNGDPDLVLLDDGMAPDSYPGDGVYAGTWVPGAGGSIGVTVSAERDGLIPGMTTFTAEVMAVVCYAYETMLPFAWEEIAATGTPLSLTCDDCYAPIPEPFPFRFYGIDRTQVWVSSNGGLYFESRGLPYGNAPIPTGSMNTLIAPFWDDLYRPSVYYQIRGIAPSRRLIVQWQDALHYSSRAQGVTFEAILYEATGEIVFQYLDTSFGSPSYDRGRSATVGIQGDPSQGVQHSYLTAALQDGSVIRFAPCADDVALSVSAVGGGSIAVDGVIYPLPARGRYPLDAIVALDAIPGPGWGFKRWLGPVTVPASPTTTVVMDASKEVVAEFAVTVIEDDDPAIAYSGAWDTYYSPAASAGHATYSSQTGATASLSFEGTGLKWGVFLGPMMGEARVSVDGWPLGLVDLYAPSLQATVLQGAGLPFGPHTVTVEVSGLRNPSASDVIVDIDYLEVIP